MYMIFASLATGILLGFFYKGELLRKWSDNIAGMMVLLLVCLMGLSLGSNQEITSNFFDLGIKAIALATFSVIGSVIAVLAFTKIFNKG